MKTQTHLIVLFFVAFGSLLSCSNDNDDNNTPDVWSCGDQIVDVDGNTYDTVSINGTCWTVQNLDTANYNDNTPIANTTDLTDWNNLTTGSWAYYNNDSALGAVHGKLYNWFTVETGKLCPQGWHIPSKNEWSSLVNSLGGSSTAAEAMKSLAGWNNSPDNATNSSGFSALPSGNRDINDDFLGLGDNVWFHTSTEDPDDDTKAFWLKVTSGTTTEQGTTFKTEGLPCRCVID
ncbi:FISUMP domain-containing protein [Psychroserpens sp. MEBiC05023]